MIATVSTIFTTVAVDGAFPIRFHFVLMTLTMSAGLKSHPPHHRGLWGLDLHAHIRGSLIYE